MTPPNGPEDTRSTPSNPRGDTDTSASVAATAALVVVFGFLSLVWSYVYHAGTEWAVVLAAGFALAAATVPPVAARLTRGFA